MIDIKYVKNRCLLAGIITLLTACNNAPQPKTVSGYSRSPINDAKTAENLANNAEIAQTNSTPVIVSEKQLQKIIPSKVILISFDYNSTAFTLTEDEQISLIYSAQQASRIDIRGRTDGKQSTKGNEKIAQGRAMAVRNYLVAQGVQPKNITLNFMAVGDNIANNQTHEGQAVNRRAEIEISFN